MEVVLASANRGKLQELSALLAGLPLTLAPMSQYGITAPEETGQTFLENALLKARHAAVLSDRPAIADDSGLVVPALGGAPGVRSARYAGDAADDEANVLHLLQSLRSAGQVSRDCFFVCVMVYLRAPDDPLPCISQGLWRGSVLEAARGDGGFGYDPVFWCADQACSAAELPADVKNRISHRGIAAADLLAQLRTEFS